MARDVDCLSFSFAFSFSFFYIQQFSKARSTRRRHGRQIRRRRLPCSQSAQKTDKKTHGMRKFFMDSPRIPLAHSLAQIRPRGMTVYANGLKPARWTKPLT
jgi:hypothetical protein